MSYTIFVPIGSCSRKSPFICIKFKDSEFCCVAGHAPSGCQWSVSLAFAHDQHNMFFFQQGSVLESSFSLFFIV